MKNTGCAEDSGMKLQVDQMVLVAIGIVIVLLFGAWAFGNWATVHGILSSSNTKLARMATKLDESEFTQYDGATVSGAQVLSVLKDYEGEEICIRVCNVSGGGSYNDYNYAFDASNPFSAPSTEKISDAENKANIGTHKYINPGAKYKGEVVREGTTKDGTIIALQFTRQ